RAPDAADSAPFGNDLAHPRAEILWKRREMVTVAHRTKTIDDRVATPIHALRLRQPDERLDRLSRNPRLRCPFTAAHGPTGVPCVEAAHTNGNGGRSSNC